LKKNITPQTLVGYVTSHTTNVFKDVYGVEYFDGATILNTSWSVGGFTLGNYILGPSGFRPDFRDHLFVHEYGHYRQSQRWGLFYLPLIAIPSLESASLDNDGGWIDIGDHRSRWFDAQASRYAADYFEEHYGSGADGYTLGSANYFDRNSFVNKGARSPYMNPRNRGHNLDGHAQLGRLHWSDPLLYLYLFLF
jgi:hypothetical protein